MLCKSPIKYGTSFTKYRKRRVRERPGIRSVIICQLAVCMIWWSTRRSAVEQRSPLNVPILWTPNHLAHCAMERCQPQPRCLRSWSKKQAKFECGSILYTQRAWTCTPMIQGPSPELGKILQRNSSHAGRSEQPNTVFYKSSPFILRPPPRSVMRERPCNQVIQQCSFYRALDSHFSHDLRCFSVCLEQLLALLALFLHRIVFIQ